MIIHSQAAPSEASPQPSDQRALASEQGLSVVVPVYDEREAIGGTLRALQQVLREAGLAHEIIVVDDGSTDGTADIVSQVAGVRLVSHSVNRGYGASLKSGIQQATHRWIAIVDADGTYPVQQIPALHRLAVSKNSAMVVGARTGRKVSIPLMRRPAKWFLGRLAARLTRREIPDLNSGLRVMDGTLLPDFMHALPDGFSFTTTLTIGMLCYGLSVEFVPIDYYARKGRSKIRPIQDTLNFMQLILRTVLYFDPLRIFLPLSGLIVLAGLLWGIFSYAVLGRLADVSTLLIILTGLQIGALGLLADLIDHKLPNPGRKADMGR